MKRQKSFENDQSTLYLVATPIGNLNEFTKRAIDILKSVNYIACEDTRTSKTLLDKYEIKARLISYHNFNESDSSNGLLKLLAEGEDVALISDAGYPLISDPGYEIANRAIDEGFNVVTVSGPSAGLHALVSSGLETRHYLFYGFMSKVKKELEDLKKFPYTMIFYESPHRINETLKVAFEVLGDRKVCLARELSKKHEEYIRGNLSELLNLEDLKGEIVLIIEGYHKENDVINYYMIKDTIDNYIESGMTSKDAIKKVSKELGISKNDIYREYHALEKQ